MKKLLIVLTIALVLVLSACDKKTTEPTDTTPTLFEPYIDEGGKLNVDVSDYVFE